MCKRIRRDATGLSYLWPDSSCIKMKHPRYTSLIKLFMLGQRKGFVQVRRFFLVVLRTAQSSIIGSLIVIKSIDDDDDFN